MLALSRNLRSKVPLESYLVGIQIEYAGRASYWKLPAEPDASHPFHSSHVRRHGLNETPVRHNDPETPRTDDALYP